MQGKSSNCKFIKLTISENSTKPKVDNSCKFSGGKISILTKIHLQLVDFPCTPTIYQNTFAILCSMSSIFDEIKDILVLRRVLELE